MMGTSAMLLRLRRRGTKATRLVCTAVTAVVACSTAGSFALGQPSRTAPERPTPRAAAPVDLTGYWVSVVTEDWGWRMRTPPKGDYASLPLNAAGVRVADSWSEDQDGSCLAFGAAALLRMPTRLHITWAGDSTLRIATDNGEQTRLLRFESGDAASAATTGGSGSLDRAVSPSASTNPERSLQGQSRAAWQVADAVTSSGADGGILTTRLGEAGWASLKAVTTQLRAAWLRPNGVPYSENAVLTEYFDRFDDGEDQWFTVTTIVEDPAYLTEPLVISSNFKREADGSRWNPAPCRDTG